MISLGSVGPTPGIGESVELCLAYRAAGLTEENVVIRVRVKWRIEIDKIDTLVGKFLPIRKPFEIIAEVEPVSSEGIVRDVSVRGGLAFRST